MSDEPQPQQPTEGTAPGEPEAGDGGSSKKVKRPKRTGWRRLLPTWRMVLSTFVLGVLLLAGLFFLGYSMVKIPPANALATKQSNVYLYADGTEIARDGKVNRENVDLAQISKDAQHAVLAAEDRDFYTESAIDPKAMLRAGWNTATGKGKQSGSTITQQYVKNYYLAQEQTATRKVKEFFIAIKLDREKSKDEILEGYLNTSYFGRNAYGIQAAAKAYYGIDALRLTPAQGAYLAALVNAPSEYDVIAHPENRKAAEARWNYVLDGMVTKGWLTASQRTGMKFPGPKETSGADNGMSGQRGYLVNAIKDYLRDNKIVTQAELDAGGYRITTTLDKKKQNAFVDAVNDQLLKKLDKKNRKVDTYVRAGGAAVEPKTGKILALYGGVDYVKQYTNNATRQDFQVGSTFKPFVFTSAVQNDSTTQDNRRITPNTIYDGTNKRPVQGWSGPVYDPENEDYVNYGDINVRTATDKSVNSVYAQMAVDVGPAKVKQTAIALGLPTDTPELQPYPSIALGTANASVLDMAKAYATLANHGKHGMYTMISKVTKDGSDVVELPAYKASQVISREAADTTTSVLRSVVQNGTARKAQAADRPAAGKTGTAEEDQAAWFAGYTPDLATVVAVMGQDPVTAHHKSLKGALGLPRINGGDAPTQIWAQFTEEALKGSPAKDFDLTLQEGGGDSAAPSDPADDPDEPSDDDTGDSTPSAGTKGQTQGQTQGQSQGQTGGGTTTGGDTTGDTSTGATGGNTADGGTSTGTTNGGSATNGTTSGANSGTTDGGGTSTGTADGGGGSDAGNSAGTTVGPQLTPTRRE
ncbi:transglycosylase domain-containing protein [Streptomyces sp. ID05-04B]|uniref:transglycosylase domain-containing protein n=1 Tax=unclassified Streptomyces TaxID=2593676 RepID=UPI000D1BFA2D|nr:MULTISPECIES: transglycosylase domain-containing protein [unclassified Streptomyces]AVV42405.1 penicillin-binding protein [Streptomyces sp. P3]MDX5568995.1 transglycosylase domain-containing protein [Streptomyces sp. ID05-04B]